MNERKTEGELAMQVSGISNQRIQSPHNPEGDIDLGSLGGAWFTWEKPMQDSMPYETPVPSKYCGEI